MITLENWSKTVLFVCAAALAIDPLFFFIPVVDSHGFCLIFDKKLGAAVCVLRTLIDTFYVIHITLHFIKEIIPPLNQLCKCVEATVRCGDALKKRGVLFFLVVDIVSVLPIPQVAVITLTARKRHSDASLVSKGILKWIIFLQYVPRIIRIYPHYREVSKDTGKVAETRLIGAAFNLFFYMMQSHVFGALWYLGAVEKRDQCWREACAKTPGCDLMNLTCARGGQNNIQFLHNSCPLISLDDTTSSEVFNFGMYINALKSRIVESRDFPRKFFVCFWWGLRNLSALGQNLEASDSVEEIFFAITICVSGMLLFAVFIGNVQKYLQPLTIRVDELKEKKRDLEKWMSNRMLPEDLRDRIRRYEDCKWRETRGTEEETLLRSLPKDLRMETKQHLHLEFLGKVRPFGALGVNVRKELCTRLKAVHYTEKSYVVSRGDRLEEMLFIVSGEVSLMQSTGTRCWFSDLRDDGFCGDIISPTLFHPHASHVPISSITVRTKTEVKGLVLSADDFRSVATQYPDLRHRRRVHHTFRVHSVEWRTWAARFIQASWRRYRKRKLLKALREEEGNLHNKRLQNDDPGSNKVSLGSIIYGSASCS